MRKTLLAVVIMFAAVPAFASDVYFAQSAAGGGAGTSCATAEALTTFNAGSATAGNTYHLCGTITAQVTPPVCTSGSTGTKCELLFESGGSIQMAAISATGGVNLNSNPFWIVDGGIPCGRNSTGGLTACASGLTGTGFIESTNNGSSPTFANQVASIGVNLGSTVTHDVEIRNLLLLNLYVRNVTTDVGTGAQNSYGVYGLAGNNVLVHDLTSEWSRGNIFMDLQTGSNTQVYNNVTAHGTWGIVAAEGSTTLIYTGAYVYNNDINEGSDWLDTSGGNNFHLDGIFVFGQGATGYVNGAYIYNNYMHGSWESGSGLCPTGYVYANQNLQNLYIFNNIFAPTAGYACNGFIALGYSTVSELIANNTFYGYGAATCLSVEGSVCLALGDAGAVAANSTTVYNEIVYNMNSNFDFNHSGPTSILAYDYNAEFGWDTHGQGPWNNGTEYDTLAAWQAVTCGSTACDGHAVSATPNLNSSTFVPNSGSPVIAAGINLHSTCNGQATPGLGALCSDELGNVRPTSAAWDMGALNSGSTPQAATPTFSPVAGTYSGTQSVTPSTSSSGAIICYNTTGSPATNGTTGCTTGTLFTTAISVATSETVYAVAGGTGYTDSAVGSAAYTITGGGAGATGKWTMTGTYTIN